MNHPLISVVMINYNAGPLLRLAIESILIQKKMDFELIIVDDASHDDGPEIIRQYANRDPRVQAILRDDNRGISATRNEGIASARGTYISLIDGDDLHLSDTLEKQLDHFTRLREQHPELCFLASDAWLINERGKRGGRYMPTAYWSGDHIAEDCPRWTLPSSWFFPSDVPVRFHDGYRFSDAPIFVHRMAAHGTIAYIGEPLVEYRLRVSSATNALAARVVRDLNAAARSLEIGQLNSPVPSSSMPEPSWSQVAAWKYGRNAKAAMINDRKLRALRDLAVATCANPSKTCGKLIRFFQQKLRQL